MIIRFIVIIITTLISLTISIFKANTTDFNASELPRIPTPIPKLVIPTLSEQSEENPEIIAVLLSAKAKMNEWIAISGDIIFALNTDPLIINKSWLNNLVKKLDDDEKIFNNLAEKIKNLYSEDKVVKSALYICYFLKSLSSNIAIELDNYCASFIYEPGISFRVRHILCIETFTGRPHNEYQTKREDKTKLPHISHDYIVQQSTPFRLWCSREPRIVLDLKEEEKEAK